MRIKEEKVGHAQKGEREKRYGTINVRKSEIGRSRTQEKRKKKMQREKRKGEKEKKRGDKNRDFRPNT